MVHKNIDIVKEAVLKYLNEPLNSLIDFDKQIESLFYS